MTAPDDDRPRPRLGLDAYSLRSTGWGPLELLEHAAGLGAEVVQLSEPRFIGALDEGNLRTIRARADELGVDLEVGMGSICPSSGMFRPDDGTAVEQLTRMLHVAAALRSPIVRCYLGSAADRGPAMETHVANTIATCRAVERTALELGVKVVIENHAGDLQTGRLRDLIERAGPHFVGALFDAGNASWTLEDPIAALETIAPHVLTSGIRDAKVWETTDGAAVEWVAMGDGDGQVGRLAQRYAELCPGKAFCLEVIPHPPRSFPWRRPGFWDAYRDVPAWVFAGFLDWVRQGMERHGPGDEPLEAPNAGTTAAREVADVAAAMAFARTALGLGRPTPGSPVTAATPAIPATAPRS